MTCYTYLPLNDMLYVYKRSISSRNRKSTPQLLSSAVNQFANKLGPDQGLASALIGIHTV